MTVRERIEKLREKMRMEGITAYLVPSDDFHGSEYVGAHFKCREFITGFTGSAGTALILEKKAVLWTDGRYFEQAEAELSGTGVELFRMGEDGVPTVRGFLEKTLKKGDVLGMDGRCVSQSEMKDFREILSRSGAGVRNDTDLIGEIWEERPGIAFCPVFDLDIRWCGISREQKLSDVREKMDSKGAEGLLLSSLEDIAWLLNLRSRGDVMSMVFPAYLFMDQHRVVLFTDKKCLPEEILADGGIDIEPYDRIYPFLESATAASIMLWSAAVNSRLYSCIPENVKIVDEENPTYLARAVKNPVEAANMRTAHIKDGAAVLRFIRWLKENAGHSGVTEMSAAEKLYSFREEQENFLCSSFDPIIAYREHGSIIHYSADETTDVPIRAEGMVLCDTGGQYLEGTTDITRTVVVGPVTEEEKYYFTMVLKGHLSLMDAVFKEGCTGQNLDYLAREPLWRIGKDYNHGTGHGVGYLLNVHEGPNGFRYKAVPERNDRGVFQEGMITSDEPGYYAEGRFGIRHESLLLCVKGDKTEAGQFMRFEPLTMVPFDPEGIDASLLTEREKEILNRYHRTVAETLAPYLTEEEKHWLAEATRPL